MLEFLMATTAICTLCYVAEKRGFFFIFHFSFFFFLFSFFFFLFSFFFFLFSFFFFLIILFTVPNLNAKGMSGREKKYAPSQDWR